jgi:hypothetical protein
MFEKQMRRTCDDIGNLGKRRNPDQHWLHFAKGEASIRWSSGLAESASSEAKRPPLKKQAATEE